MRRHFGELLHQEMSRDQNIIVLTGDLGYGLWDKIRIDYPTRFYNVGSSEQLMIGMAVGASKRPWQSIRISMSGPTASRIAAILSAPRFSASALSFPVR